MVLLPHVFLEVLGPLEALSTNLTTKRSLLRVGGEMTLQFVLAGTLTPTHFADVLVLSSPKEDVASSGYVQVRRVELSEGCLNIWAQSGTIQGGVAERRTLREGALSQHTFVRCAAT